MIFKQLLLIDLDRTIFDSDKFLLVLDKFLQKQYHNSDLLEWVNSCNKKGISFDLEQFLNHNIIFDDNFRLKLNQFISQNKTDFWLGNAKQVITKLNQLSLPYFILTYGQTYFQTLKLQTLGIKRNYIITNVFPKSQLITKWYQKGDNCCFQINNQVRALKLILVDDNLSNLKNLPTNCRAIYLGDQHPPQKITKIATLSQLFDLI